MCIVKHFLLTSFWFYSCSGIFDRSSLLMRCCCEEYSTNRFSFASVTNVLRLVRSALVERNVLLNYAYLYYDVMLALPSNPSKSIGPCFSISFAKDVNARIDCNAIKPSHT